MLDVLSPQSADDPEYFAFVSEEAIYWFANDYHGGQGSNLYSALSTSGFRPGPLARGPDAGESSFLYAMLEEAFA